MHVSCHPHSLDSISTPSRYFTLVVWLSCNSSSIQFVTLVDYGASSCFIDVMFTQAHGVPIIFLSKLISIVSASFHQEQLLKLQSH